MCGAHLAHAHDVVDLHALARSTWTNRSNVSAAHLLGVADDVIDLRHVRKALGLDLRRAARDDDASLGLVAAKSCGSSARLDVRLPPVTAQVLTMIGVLQPGVFGVTAHDLGLKRVEPAA